ncbi:uncharacterized protein LOC127094476 [Lathyrus oleraceus]|uniref:uncharacterized protein LOC127094476 n=1 Tax=Pisum sativum TaxID=3888 RepID=UPI0021D00F1C|nr:uncharacterized protein LOC127094476 [Pisum sativum]
MEQLQENQVALQEEVSQVRSQMWQLMETNQAVTRGQEIRAKMQEEMNQHASTTNPPTLPVVETPTPVPQFDTPINISAPDGVPNENPRPHVFEIDDQHDAFFSRRVTSQYDAFGSATNEVERMVKAIEEKLKAMGNTDVLGLDAAEMCLVLGVIIPTKFKVPDFEKYKGNSNPMTHIRAYCRKMPAYSSDDQLLMLFSKIPSVGHLWIGI